MVISNSYGSPIGVVNLFSYAIFLEFAFSFFMNLWISQMARCIIDHPKMAILKKANLLKVFEAIAKSHAIFTHALMKKTALMMKSMIILKTRDIVKYLPI